MFTHRTVSIVIKSYPATYTEFDKQSKYIDIELYDHITASCNKHTNCFSLFCCVPACIIFRGKVLYSCIFTTFLNVCFPLSIYETNIVHDPNFAVESPWSVFDSLALPCLMSAPAAICILILAQLKRMGRPSAWAPSTSSVIHTDWPGQWIIKVYCFAINSTLY